MSTSVKEVLKNTNLSQNKPLNQIVYESFRKTIIEGKIPTGERINEKEYAGSLNISRTPIRNALKKLEQEGLVEYIPKIGVIVKQVTIKDVIEIYEIRRAMETLAITAAMQKMTEKDTQELESLIIQMEEANKEGNIKAVFQLFEAFHQFMYEKSELHRVSEVISKISEYLNRFRDISLNSNIRREQSIVEHRKIYQAMIERNEARVKLIVRNHLNESLNFVMQEITKEHFK